MHRNTIAVATCHTPCGTLLLGAFEDKLCLCDWQTNPLRERTHQRLQRLLHADFIEATSPVIEQASVQLREYFLRTCRSFNISLLFAGTDFQKTVWNELMRIPYGVTISYTDLARRIGMSSAVRAVANACAANALSIFVPCHRVIGHNTSLTGYAGGLPAKQWLLNHEETPSQPHTHKTP